MADVSKISLYGTTYTIKDSTARTNAATAQTAANTAKATAATAQTTANEAKAAALVISYASEEETIVVEKLVK
mgnify:CR=1 FL=1|jgi:hypothetical protein|nr:MAG TPA: hypothetical protein [Caudoviricetes sp.]